MRAEKKTLKEVLDLAATPDHRDEYHGVEAFIALAGGCARSTHLFCYYKETPVRKRRWFDHFMNICDAWEVVSEKRLMETYGEATWWIWREK